MQSVIQNIGNTSLFIINFIAFLRHSLYESYNFWLKAFIFRWMQYFFQKKKTIHLWLIAELNFKSGYRGWQSTKRKSNGRIQQQWLHLKPLHRQWHRRAFIHELLLNFMANRLGYRLMVYDSLTKTIINITIQICMLNMLNSHTQPLIVFWFNNKLFPAFIFRISLTKLIFR